MKSRRIWRTGLIALGILAGAWAFAALLLPVLWPFLIGLAVSLLAEKPVRLLQTRARFPRWLASGVCVLTLFVLLFGGAFFLCRLLCMEAADLARAIRPRVVVPTHYSHAAAARQFRQLLEGTVPCQILLENL